MTALDSLFSRQPWLITTDAMQGMVAQAVAFFDARIQLPDASRNALLSVSDGVAIIDLHGPLMRQPDLISSLLFGATDMNEVTDAIQEAVQRDDVQSILLDIDSPGGTVNGTPELAQAVADASKLKPAYAFSAGQMCSAAYWIASAASEFIVTPSGSVGSIGVLGVHEDRSAGLAAEGKKLTFIHAGKYKVEGNSAEPLSDEARATIQAMVDQAYGVMVRSIARNRGVSPDAVRSQYGEGRMFSAEDAMSRGMVDRVATLEETIARMGNPRRRSRLAAANNAVRIAAL